jgi:hypothetical protein
VLGFGEVRPGYYNWAFKEKGDLNEAHNEISRKNILNREGLTNLFKPFSNSTRQFFHVSLGATNLLMPR